MGEGIIGMRTNYDRWFGNPERAAASVSRIIDWYETQLHGQHRQFPVTGALGWDTDEIVMECLPIAGHKSLADTNDAEQSCRQTRRNRDDDAERHAEQGTGRDRQEGTTLPTPTNTLLHQGSLLAWMNAPSDERNANGTTREARRKTPDNDIADRERRYWLAMQNAAMRKAICTHADTTTNGAARTLRHGEPELLAMLCEDGWFDLGTTDDPTRWARDVNDIIHSTEKPDEDGTVCSVWERDGTAIGIRDCIAGDRFEIAIEKSAMWNKFSDAACSIMLPRTGITDREYHDATTLLHRLSSLTARERGVLIEQLRDERFPDMTHRTTARGKRNETGTQRRTQRTAQGRRR